MKKPSSAKGLAAALALLAVLAGGCSTASTEAKLMLFAQNAALPAVVAPGQELAAAEKVAKAEPGCFAVVGEGTSMEPVYRAGTAVVVRAGDYERLRVGIPVVYKNRAGIAVAHMLVGHDAEGWIAVGLDNEECDRDRVTRENFVGIITQAFASRIGALPDSVAARYARADRIRYAARVANAGESNEPAKRSGTL